jgi:hypothetical protein
MPKKPQIEKFRETARAHEADEDEEKFNAALRKIAAGKPGALEELANQLEKSNSNKDFGKKPK